MGSGAFRPQRGRGAEPSPLLEKMDCRASLAMTWRGHGLVKHAICPRQYRFEEHLGSRFGFFGGYGFGFVVAQAV